MNRQAWTSRRSFAPPSSTRSVTPWGAWDSCKRMWTVASSSADSPASGVVHVYGATPWGNPGPNTRWSFPIRWRFPPGLSWVSLVALLVGRASRNPPSLSRKESRRAMKQTTRLKSSRGRVPWKWRLFCPSWCSSHWG